MVCENDTFLIFLQKVSSKYHKFARSIIKIAIEVSQNRHKASQKRHKVSYINAKPSIRTKCPNLGSFFGHSIPAVRATNARNLVCRCPSLGS